MNTKQVLMEMGFPLNNRKNIWKHINELLKQDKWEEAVKYYFENGGTARGLQKSWNVAQANTSGSSSAKPDFYGTLDKDFSINKFRSYFPKEEKLPKKNKKREEKPADLDDLIVFWRTVASKRRGDFLEAKNETYKGYQIIKKFAKEHKFDSSKGYEGKKKFTKENGYDPSNDRKAILANLEKYADEAKEKEEALREYKKLLSKDDSKLTLPERKRLLELKNKTESYRVNKAEAKQQAREEVKVIESLEELENLLDYWIKNKKRIDDRKLYVEVIKAISKFAKGQKAVDLKTKVRQIFRTYNNKDKKDDLLHKYNTEVMAGKKHYNTVKKIVDKYNNGDEITRDDLKTLKREISSMFKVMADDIKYDKQGFKAYAAAKNNIDKALAKPELDIDSIEDALDDLAKYYNTLKEENNLIKEIKMISLF